MTYNQITFPEYPRVSLEKQKATTLIKGIKQLFSENKTSVTLFSPFSKDSSTPRAMSETYGTEGQPLKLIDDEIELFLKIEEIGFAQLTISTTADKLFSTVFQGDKPQSADINTTFDIYLIYSFKNLIHYYDETQPKFINKGGNEVKIPTSIRNFQTFHEPYANHDFQFPPVLGVAEFDSLLEEVYQLEYRDAQTGERVKELIHSGLYCLAIESGFTPDKGPLLYSQQFQELLKPLFGNSHLTVSNWIV